MTDQIKSCPFCGNAWVYLCEDEGLAWAYCSGCNTEGPYTERKAAIDKWNAAPRNTPAERELLDAAEAWAATQKRPGKWGNKKVKISPLGVLLESAEELYRERLGGSDG